MQDTPAPAGRHTRARRPGARLVAGGALLAGCGAALLLWPAAAVTADVGSVRVAAAPPLPAEPTRADSPALPSADRPGLPPASVDRGFVPTRLVVPGVGIDAPLLPTSTGDDGTLVPPDDPADLGWWRGVRPGHGAGSVLVAGHLDSRRYGRGPLGALVDLGPGDRATVTGPDGASATYVLRGVEVFAKDALPAAELFGYDGGERLVLVTCGGTFDQAAGGWDSNVVAVLDPIPT